MSKFHVEEGVTIHRERDTLQGTVVGLPTAIKPEYCVSVNPNTWQYFASEDQLTHREIK